jgi:hypothetical protein
MDLLRCHPRPDDAIRAMVLPAVTDLRGRLPSVAVRGPRENPERTRYLRTYDELLEALDVAIAALVQDMTVDDPDDAFARRDERALAAVKARV